MPQPQIPGHHTLRRIIVFPRFFAIERIIRAVKPVDGRKDAQLYPADGQVVIPHASHVPADIVAPPSVADIGGVRGEIRLECQAVPGDHRISGKSHRIPVAARPCIAGECQSPRAGAPAVQIMIMVEHPQRVQALDLRGIPLLPVNPPEINAFFLHRMKYRFKICFQELRIRHVKLYRVPAFRVDPHPPGDFRITFFIGADAVGRMKIQGRLHSVRVQPVHKLLRIREQGRVPGIAGPAAPVSGIHLLHQMPVHVNDRDRKRNPFLLKAFHKLFIFRLIIPVITAPPVAEHKAGQQRLLSAQMIESLQAIEISVSVSPEIEIDGFPAARRDRTVRQDRHGTGIVHHGKPGFRHQSGFQRDGSVRRIKGTGCAAQVTQFVPITPQPLRRTAARHADHQAARRKLLFIVMNLHRSRKDMDSVFVS